MIQGKLKIASDENHYYWETIIQDTKFQVVLGIGPVAIVADHINVGPADFQLGRPDVVLNQPDWNKEARTLVNIALHDLREHLRQKRLDELEKQNHEEFVKQERKQQALDLLKMECDLKA